MVWFTADRLCQTLFPFKYRSTWIARKTKIVLVVNWFLIIGSLLRLRLLHHHVYVLQSFPNHARAYFTFFYLLFSIITYFLMFVTYIKSRRNAQPTQQLSTWRIFRNSRFYFSFLLVGSFFVLTVIPWVCYFIAEHTKYKAVWGRIIPFITVTLYLSSTVDWVLYMYLQNQVREMLSKMCSYCRRQRRGDNNAIEMARHWSLKVLKLSKKEFLVNPIWLGFGVGYILGLFTEVESVKETRKKYTRQKYHWHGFDEKTVNSKIILTLTHPV